MPTIINITDFSAAELDIYARHSENQLYRYREPELGLFIAESPRVIERALQAGYQPHSCLAECREAERQAALLAQLGEIPIYTAEADLLQQLTGFPLTRGLLCAMNRRTLPSAEEVLRGARRVAVLEDVVNPTNVGAIFRSAAALNMDAVLLSPGCCDPLYRRAIRVSMGTVFQIPWTSFDKRLPWPEEGLVLLRRLGFHTVAMALREDSVSIDDESLRRQERLAIVLGTEGDGLAERTLAGCDDTVKIPMAHGVDSLNVAAASAVAFWMLAGQGETI